MHTQHRWQQQCGGLATTASSGGSVGGAAVRVCSSMNDALHFWFLEKGDTSQIDILDGAIAPVPPRVGLHRQADTTKHGPVVYIISWRGLLGQYTVTTTAAQVI